MNQLKESSENTLNTPDIHIDTTGDNTDNVNHSMILTDGQSIMATQDEHSVTAADEYTVEQA